MKFISYLKSILFAGCFFFSASGSAQNWEADIVRTANNEHHESQIWEFTTNSVRPVSAGMPLILLSAGLVTKNKKLQKQSLEMVGGLLITIGTTEALKQLVNRKRPYQLYSAIYPDEFKDGKSFPSGHASLAFFTATSLSINHPKWYVMVPSYGWALAVCYTRLYYGQHHPTDLMASAVVGAGSAWLANRAHKWLTTPRKSPAKTPVL